MPTRPWREIRDSAVQSEGHEERVAALSRDREREAVEHQLAELREQRAAVRADLARALEIDQVSLSRRERPADLLLSTLRDRVEALGGRLVLHADFDGERIPLDIGMQDAGREAEVESAGGDPSPDDAYDRLVAATTPRAARRTARGGRGLRGHRGDERGDARRAPVHPWRAAPPAAWPRCRWSPPG